MGLEGTCRQIGEAAEVHIDLQLVGYDTIRWYGMVVCLDKFFRSGALFQFRGVLATRYMSKSLSVMAKPSPLQVNSIKFYFN